MKKENKKNTNTKKTFSIKNYFVDWWDEIKTDIKEKGLKNLIFSFIMIILINY